MLPPKLQRLSILNTATSLFPLCVFIAKVTAHWAWFDRWSIFALNGTSPFCGRHGVYGSRLVSLIRLISLGASWDTLSGVVVSTTRCGKYPFFVRLCGHRTLSNPTQIVEFSSGPVCWHRWSPKALMDLMCPSSIQLKRVGRSVCIWLLHVPGDMYAGNIFVCCSNVGGVGRVGGNFIFSSVQDVWCQKNKKGEFPLKKGRPHTKSTRHGTLPFSEINTLTNKSGFWGTKPRDFFSR